MLRCNGCQKLLPHPRSLQGAPTSKMNAHKEQCVRLKKLISEKDSPNSITNHLMKTKQLQKPTVAEVKDVVGKFFVDANVPFRQADNEYFRELLSMIPTSNGEPVSLSRKIIARHVMNQSELVYVDLKNYYSSLESKVSISLDNWSSRNGIAYMGNHLYSQ